MKYPKLSLLPPSDLLPITSRVIQDINVSFLGRERSRSENRSGGQWRITSLVHEVLTVALGLQQLGKHLPLILPVHISAQECPPPFPRLSGPPLSIVCHHSFPTVSTYRQLGCYYSCSVDNAAVNDLK